MAYFLVVTPSQIRVNPESAKKEFFKETECPNNWFN